MVFRIWWRDRRRHRFVDSMIGPHLFPRVAHLVEHIPQMVMNPIRKKSPTKQIQDTVDGQNPAPPGMVKTL